MTEHPRVLVEAARLQAMGVEERLGMGNDSRMSAQEMDRIERELVEDEDQLAEMEALMR